MRMRRPPTLLLLTLSYLNAFDAQITYLHIHVYYLQTLHVNIGHLQTQAIAHGTVVFVAAEIIYPDGTASIAQRSGAHSFDRHINFKQVKKLFQICVHTCSYTYIYMCFCVFVNPNAIRNIQQNYF